MKVASIVGARPQFIKAAMVSRVLRGEHEEYLIHTGQHYDENLSKVFFDVLDIPNPDINLGIGSGPHGYQTGRMLEALEAVLMKWQPEMVLVYGDTNSTLAGALAAVKLGQKLAHVEAGVRSFNMSMPEEINRVLVDRISNHLFCPTETAVQNLTREGTTEGVHLVGDVMYDAALRYAEAARSKHACREFDVDPKDYLVLTIHRPENADHLGRLETILKAVESTGWNVIFPAHPRTRRVIEQSKITGRLKQVVRITEPVDYLTFISLLMDAEKVVTDSGGVQKEAYIFGVPCITLREETEWEETLDHGWNVLVDGDSQSIVRAIEQSPRGSPKREVFGNGRAAQKIVETLA